MTLIVNDTAPRKQYEATAAQDTFAYTFPIYEDSDLVVYLTPVGQAADDAADILTLTTDYTVSGEGTSNGGNVVLVVAATAGDIITIHRDIPVARTSDYQTNGDLQSTSLNDDLDKLVMMVQQQEESIDDRTLKFIETANLAGVDPAVPAPEALKVIRWNAAGTALENTDDPAVSADAAAASADAALVSEGLADADATQTALDVIATNADVVTTNADVTYSAEWANKAEDILVSVAAGGDGVDDYSSKHFSIKSGASAVAAALSASSAASIPARNAVQNQDALSQGESTRAGMSSTIYTGNGATQSVTTGLDMATGDFGGLVWVKQRNGAADSHRFVDTVRGATIQLYSDQTAAEQTSATALTSFDSTGFSVGADAGVNENTLLYASWSFQTTKKKTGTTNRNKAYTAHYNPDMNFSIVGYEGDGVDGHEIPHHLGVVPELTLFFNRDSVVDNIVKSSLFSSDEYLFLNSTIALTVGATTDVLFGAQTLQLDSYSGFNESTKNIIMYNFASKSGVCKIGKYIGTGAAGNYVSTEVDGGDAFKPSFVMVKNLTTGSTEWLLYDAIRTFTGGITLSADSSAAEATNANRDIDVDDNGIVVNGTSANLNALNSEYLFMAFAETSIDATKAVTNYDYPTTADTLSIVENTLVSAANGFNANGEVNTQYQFGAGKTHALGVGYEDKKLYVYTDKLGNIGTTEVRPLVGLTRKDADKYGEVSPTDALALDIRSRTTDKHFDYESASGVVLASGELAGDYYAHNAFDKDSNDITGAASWVITATGASWVQYKHSEKRILKSWRLREEIVARTPKRFTIEAQNEGDGATWVEIDATYKATTGVDYVGNGANLWGDLQDVSANTTAYDYHRINITANNGDATYTSIQELELNTVLATDYYLVDEAKMYDSSDVAQERVYLGEVITDSTGDISSYVSYTPAKQQVTDIEVHGDLTVHGEIENRGVCTAWVNFDGTQTPPLIRDSYNVYDIRERSAGDYHIIFDEEMDDVGYTVVGSADPNRLFYIYINRTTEAEIVIRTDGGASIDAANIKVAIFGGRKIK